MCQMAYRRNQRNSNFQQALSTFFKAKATPTKVVSLTHQFGLTTTYRWTTDRINKISESETRDLQQFVKDGGRLLLVYDNIRLDFHKETQRVNNQTHGDNGTAVSAIPLSGEAASLISHYGELYMTRQVELRNLSEYPRVKYHDLFVPEQSRYIASHSVYQLIKTLMDSPDFDDYPLKGTPGLARPPPVHCLPTGRQNRTEYWMVAAWPIEEGSYEGNLLVISQILKHLYNGSIDADLQEHIAEGGIPLVGDQLTYTRAAHLQLMRQEDDNPFDRFQWLIGTFGWFHVQMNLANLILKNHRGTRSSFGFARDICRLELKGLASDTSKPYYHTVDELILLETEARNRELWYWVSQTESLAELRHRVDNLGSNGPAEIRRWAEKALKERASLTAVENLKQLGQTDDSVLHDGILQHSDILLYSQIRDAIRNGDVGHLEYLVPHLAIFFHGGGSVNYAKLMVEYIQWKLEAPLETRFGSRFSCLVFLRDNIGISFVITAGLQTLRVVLGLAFPSIGFKRRSMHPLRYEIGSDSLYIC
jgi:hypothetical protein